MNVRNKERILSENGSSSDYIGGNKNENANTK